MFGFEPIQGVAGGVVRPARFITVSKVADYTLLECLANEFSVGISDTGPRDAPVDNASQVIAEAGDPFHYNPEGNICYLEIGVGGCARGTFLKPDAVGMGVQAATTGAIQQMIGAIALESAAAGEYARVLVKCMGMYPALVLLAADESAAKAALDKEAKAAEAREKEAKEAKDALEAKEAKAIEDAKKAKEAKKSGKAGDKDDKLVDDKPEAKTGQHAHGHK